MSPTEFTGWESELDPFWKRESSGSMYNKKSHFGKRRRPSVSIRYFKTLMARYMSSEE